MPSGTASSRLWAGAPTLVAESFDYVGDGSGDIRLRIGPSSPGSGRFAGTIDRVSIAASDATPFRITQVVRDPGTSAVTITFDSVDGAAYELWGSPDLQSWQDLENDVTGEGESTQVVDATFSPANPDRFYYQVRRP